MIDNRLLNYLDRRWYNISKFTDRRDLVGWLLDYMKKYNIKKFPFDTQEQDIILLKEKAGN